MKAEPAQDEIEAFYRMHWYFRYPIGIALIAGAGWLLNSASYPPSWVVYIGCGSLALSGAFAMRELSLVVMGLLLIYGLWVWQGTWSPVTRGTVAIVFLISYVAFRLERTFVERIDLLQRAIDDLRNRHL